MKGSGFKDVLSSTGNHSGQSERDVSVRKNGRIQVTEELTGSGDEVVSS